MIRICQSDIGTFLFPAHLFAPPLRTFYCTVTFTVAVREMLPDVAVMVITAGPEFYGGAV